MTSARHHRIGSRVIRLALATNASIDVNYDEKGGFRAWVRYGRCASCFIEPEKRWDSRKYRKEPEGEDAPAGGAAGAESKKQNRSM